MRVFCRRCLLFSFLFLCLIQRFLPRTKSKRSVRFWTTCPSLTSNINLYSLSTACVSFFFTLGRNQSPWRRRIISHSESHHQIPQERNLCSQISQEDGGRVLNVSFSDGTLIIRSWWLILGNGNSELLALRRVQFRSKTVTKLTFEVPEEEGSDVEYWLYLMCDSYIGLDQQIPVRVVSLCRSLIPRSSSKLQRRIRTRDMKTRSISKTSSYFSFIHLLCRLINTRQSASVGSSYVVPPILMGNRFGSIDILHSSASNFNPSYLCPIYKCFTPPTPSMNVKECNVLRSISL